MPQKEIRMPKLPECWESCGSCGQGELSVLEIPVSIGEHVGRDQTIVVVETGKVALDIPSPSAGIVDKIWVAKGDPVGEGCLLLTLI